MFTPKVSVKQPVLGPFRKVSSKKVRKKFENFDFFGIFGYLELCVRTFSKLFPYLTHLENEAVCASERTHKAWGASHQRDVQAT